MDPARLRAARLLPGRSRWRSFGRGTFGTPLGDFASDYYAGSGRWFGGWVRLRELQLGYTDAVMNHRRAFLQTLTAIGAAAAAQATPQTLESDRQYWV